MMVSVIMVTSEKYVSMKTMELFSDENVLTKYKGIIKIGSVIL